MRQTFAYGPDPAQSLDLYPVANGGPTLVFVHGGAWQSGSRHEFDAVALWLQSEGFLAATVDYRLSPAVQHPTHAEDVALSLAWLAAHEGGPLFVVGHSAGAHIAMTIAATPRLLEPAPTALFVGLEGIYDVPGLAARWPSYPDWFLRKAFGDDPALWPEAQTPVSRAPWLLVHSEGDELVDQGQRDAFADRLRTADVEVETLTPKGETHDGVVRALAAPGDEVLQAIVAFAKRRFLSLKAQP